MIRRRLIVAAALALVGAESMRQGAYAQPAADLLDEIARRLDSPEVLRGEFEQTKTLKGFSRPLVSRGSFVMARGRGVQWLTVRPFASTLVVTRDRLLTLGEDGSKQQVDTRQEPGLRAVNEMLMALLAGDVKALAPKFKAEGNASGVQDWRLVLTPRDAGLAAFIARIELGGDRHVNGVTLHEASGDTSRIRFSNFADTSLSAAEAGRFNP